MKKTFCFIIDHLSSLTFTLIILTFLTLTVSITIMEEEIISIFQNYRLSQEVTIYSLFTMFGFSDLYNSWWFKTLVVLFSINLLVCTLKHIPKTLKLLGPFRPGSNNSIPSNVCYKESFSLNALHRNYKHRLQYLLSQKLSSPTIHQEGNASVFFSQKGRYAHLGFYCAHVSLLILLFGGVVGSSSYNGDVSMREGEIIDTVFIKKDRDPCIKKLDFAIRLDQSEVVTAAKRGNHSPKNPYRSTITIVRKGERVKTDILEGYQTINYNGVRIAQSRLRDKGSYRISLSVTPKIPGGKSRVHTLGRHDYFKVPETGHTIRIKNILSLHSSPLHENILRTSAALSQNSTASLSRHMVTLEVYGKNNKLLHAPFVFSKKSRHHHPWDKEYEFSLLEIEKDEPIYRTRLKISFEPGAQIIWAGFYIAILGFAMMFTLSHRKLWVQVEEREGNFHITLAGWASHNPEVIKDHCKNIKELTCEQVLS
jgi:cytochrome c biogenesis protein